MKLHRFVLAMLGGFALAVSLQTFAAAACRDPINAPAEVQVGDRLFRETRFAQFFFAFMQAASRARC